MPILPANKTTLLLLFCLFSFPVWRTSTKTGGKFTGTVKFCWGTKARLKSSSHSRNQERNTLRGSLFRATWRLLYSLQGWFQRDWFAVRRGDGNVCPKGQGHSQDRVARTVSAELLTQLELALCWCTLCVSLVGTKLPSAWTFNHMHGQHKSSDILFTGCHSHMESLCSSPCSSWGRLHSTSSLTHFCLCSYN